jgi:hypothetical protein
MKSQRFFLYCFSVPLILSIGKRGTVGNLRASITESCKATGVKVDGKELGLHRSLFLLDTGTEASWAFAIVGEMAHHQIVNQLRRL